MCLHSRQTRRSSCSRSRRVSRCAKSSVSSAIKPRPVNNASRAVNMSAGAAGSFAGSVYVARDSVASPPKFWECPGLEPTKTTETPFCSFCRLDSDVTLMFFSLANQFMPYPQPLVAAPPGSLGSVRSAYPGPLHRPTIARHGAANRSRPARLLLCAQNPACLTPPSIFAPPCVA